MTFLGVVEWIAVFSTGLIAGILFGDRAGNTYARRRLAPEAFVPFQREQNRRFAAMMPLPILAAVVSSSVWLVQLRDRFGTPEFALAAVGTVCLILAVVITRVVNIPINNRIDSAVSAPLSAEVLRKLWSRWERFHTVRTSLAVLAFAFQLAGLAMGPN